MSNQLSMDTVQAIHALRAQGWSRRKIARELGIHRSTVAAHLASKPAKVPTGSEGSKPAKVPTGSEGSKPAKVPTGSEVPLAEGADDFPEPFGEESSNEEEDHSRSRCVPWRDVILEKLAQGLSAQRIFQDLSNDHDYEHGYDSVKRFVRQLKSSKELPFRRMECEPGAEAQVDFGQGAPVVDESGRRRRPHLLRVVLSHSRKGYTEVIEKQTTDGFIRCLESAFWHFGGVPKTLVIDNLRAAVSKADWFDPELNPKIRAFAEHYGTVFLPTRVRMPRHKGKVERGVDYAQENALKGRTFESLREQNEHLWDWESQVADTRIHGTTREQVGKAFRERERSALLPLPLERFPFFHEAERTVHRDGHVSVEKAYYSVPPEFLGRKVWVRWDGRLVRIFNAQMEQIALHVRQEPGKFSTQNSHLHARKISGVERGATWWLVKVSENGPETRDWATAMLGTRGIEGVRVLMGLKQLTDKHSRDDIERACRTAHSYGDYRLRTVRKLIARNAPVQGQFEFLDEHPVIRPLVSYSEFVKSALRKEPNR
jgi:transposase